MRVGSQNGNGKIGFHYSKIGKNWYPTSIFTKLKITKLNKSNEIPVMKWKVAVNVKFDEKLKWKCRI